MGLATGPEYVRVAREGGEEEREERGRECERGKKKKEGESSKKEGRKEEREKENSSLLLNHNFMSVQNSRYNGKPPVNDHLP